MVVIDEELKRSVVRHCPQKVTKTALEGLTLYRTENRTDPVLVVYEPRIYVVIQGQKTLILNDHPFTYGEGEYLISGLDLPVSGRITRASETEPYLAMCLSFSPTEIEAVLQKSAGSLRKPEQSRPAMGVSAISTEVKNTLGRLMAVLDEDVPSSFLAELIKMELLYRLLQEEQGHVLYGMARGNSDIARMTKALDYMRQHFNESYEIGTLVSEAGMGQSQFYKSFSTLTGMTPVQYRTRLRLQEARRLMVVEGVKAADAGFAVGYDSPSHFSRDYRKVFSRPPHADRAYIRAIGVERYSALHEDVWR